MRYVRIRSWHVIKISSLATNEYVTYCGRKVTTFEVAAELPLDEKSCEICLRLDEGG